MTDYKEFGKKRINGVNRVIYTKPGSKKQYLKYKGRMMNIVKYKKLLANKEDSKKNAAKKSKNVKKSKNTKKYGKKRGGEPEASVMQESFKTDMKQINLYTPTS